MKLTVTVRGRKYWKSLREVERDRKREASKHDRRQAILDMQKEAREADPRPSEEIIREARDDWH